MLQESMENLVCVLFKCLRLTLFVHILLFFTPQYGYRFLLTKDMLTFKLTLHCSRQDLHSLWQQSYTPLDHISAHAHVKPHPHFCNDFSLILSHLNSSCKDTHMHPTFQHNLLSMIYISLNAIVFYNVALNQCKIKMAFNHAPGVQLKVVLCVWMKYRGSAIIQQIAMKTYLLMHSLVYTHCQYGYYAVVYMATDEIKSST